MSESKIYSIQDCYYYDSQTVDKQRYSVITGSASIGYNNNGFTVTGQTYRDTLVKNNALTLPNSYCTEVTITGIQRDYMGNCGGFVFDNCLLDIANDHIDVYAFSSISLLTTINQVIQVGDVFKIEMDNGTMKIYVNDVLKTTQSITHTGNFQYRTYNNRSTTTKDLKVKPL